MSKTVFVVSENDAGLIAMAEVLEADYKVLTMPTVERSIGKSRAFIFLNDTIRYKKKSKNRKWLA